MTVEVGAAEFEAAVEKAYKKLRGTVKVSGFRPGKAPRKVIENMYGKGAFYEEAINIAMPDAYVAAVEENTILSTPFLTILSRSTFVPQRLLV